jgi:hypothetical protein
MKRLDGIRANFFTILIFDASTSPCPAQACLPTRLS